MSDDIQISTTPSVSISGNLNSEWYKQAARIAELETALREIRDIAIYKNDGNEIVNIVDAILNEE
jgi:hypothetical protein